MIRTLPRLLPWTVAYALALAIAVVLKHDTWSAAWCLGTAVGVGLLARNGYRWWPLVLALELAASLLGGSSGPVQALVMAGSTTVEALTGAWLVRRFELRFERPEDALVLGLIAGVSATIGATLVAGLEAALLRAPDPAGLWVAWWMGGATALATVLPLVLVADAGDPAADAPGGLHGRRVEILMILAAALGMVVLALGLIVASPDHRGSFRFFWVLPVLWAAIRFERRVTSITVLVMAVGAFAVLAGESSSFDPLDVISVQGSLVTVSLVGLAVVSTLAGRRHAIAKVERTLRELEHSEHRYATLFAASPLIQFLVDPVTMRFVDANAAASEFYGWSSEEMRTLRVVDLGTARPQVLAETLVDGQAVGLHVQTEHRLASGERRHVDVQTGAVTIGGRTLHHSVVRDITAELRARSEINRLAAVVESSAEAIVTTDLAGRITDWNPAAAQLYGHPRPEVIGRHVDDVLGPVEMTPRELAGIALDGRSARFGQVVRRTAGGDTIPVDLTISPIVDGDEVVGLSRISHDLRPVLEERERLERSEALLADAAEIGAMGSWELDRTTGVATWSFELYRLAGLDPSIPVTAETLVELAHPDDRERLASAMRDHDETSEPISFRLIGPDGRERSVVARWRRVPGSSGSAGRDVGIVRDVTEERALEEQLRQAQRLESIGLLAGGVAHDFNNLLTAIAGFADLARMSVDEGGSPEADLAEVQAAVDRARALTSQLLTFGRRAINRPQPVDLGSSAEALVPLLRRLLGERITIIAELEPGAVAVIDPGQLDQVLINLAVNARDAMPAGGRLRIGVGRVQPRPGDTRPAQAWIEVEDDGEGIPPAQLDQIFLPFFTTKGRGQGTGLGLSTVQGIVGQAGGTVEVTSRIGEGTMFRVELPAVGAVEPPQPARARPERQTGDGLVLLVEDEDLVRRVAERVLVRAGFRVLAAVNQPDALAIADRERPDILVTDIVLPGIGDGISLAEKLRARWPDLPVLIVTGYTERTPPEWAALLTKPYEVDEFISLVHRLLDEARGAGIA